MGDELKARLRLQAAREFVKIVSARDKLGRPISQMDAMIAAICSSEGTAIATRNAINFEHCEIDVLDPWA